MLSEESLQSLLSSFGFDMVGVVLREFMKITLETNFEQQWSTSFQLIAHGVLFIQFRELVVQLFDEQLFTA